MNSLKLFPFMGMGDIPEGGDINELESGYYSAGNFKLLVNSLLYSTNCIRYEY